jgi:hypothetical protein
MQITNFTYSIPALNSPAKKPARIVEHEVDSPVARAKIERLQEVMLACPQVEIDVEHFHAKGLYARQGVIKKGTVLVGHIKKISHLNIVISGDISIYTEEGIQRITGPATMVSAPGTKRVGYAHEDTTWITIIATDEVDVDKIEEQVLAQSYDEYIAYCNQLTCEGA